MKKFCPDCLRWFTEHGGLIYRRCPRCLGPLMDRDDECFELDGYDDYMDDMQ